MIADAAHLLLQALLYLSLLGTLLLTATFLYGWASREIRAHRIRNWAKHNHEAQQRAEAIAARRRMTETRVVSPGDRNHPLYSLGGGRGSDQTLSRRFR